MSNTQKRKPTRQKVHDSLLEQLHARGSDIDAFIDMVNDYMTLYDAKEKLAKDIKKRGVVFEGVSSVGVNMVKNNPSVKEIVGVNRQMLAILDKLEINTDNSKTGQDDDNGL